MITLTSIESPWKFIEIENTKHIKDSIIGYEIDAPEQSELDIFFDTLESEVDNADIGDDTTLYYSYENNVYTVFYKKSNGKFEKVGTIDEEFVSQ